MATGSLYLLSVFIGILEGFGANVYLGLWLWPNFKPVSKQKLSWGANFNTVHFTGLYLQACSLIQACISEQLFQTYDFTHKENITQRDDNLPQIIASLIHKVYTFGPSISTSGC